MGKLPEVRLVPFEEHLLACEACQDRLLETEAFVNAVRSVSPKLRAASSSPRRNRFRQKPTGWRRSRWAWSCSAWRIWLVARRAPMDFAAVFSSQAAGSRGWRWPRPDGKALALTID